MEWIDKHNTNFAKDYYKSNLIRKEIEEIEKYDLYDDELTLI